jgi:hypothetical protein
MLLNKDANKTGILRALKTMRAAMEKGGINDLVVIHFSSHGALVDHKLYGFTCCLTRSMRETMPASKQADCRSTS